MLKKLIVCLILTAMMFTTVLSGGALAAIGDLASLSSGVIVIEGTYTAAASGDSRIYFGPSWQTFFKISGTNVYEKPSDTSAGNIVTLTEDDSYFFTIVYNRNKINSYTFGSSSIYINGVRVKEKWADYTMSNQAAFNSIGDYGKTNGMQNLTISYATEDLTYEHDMAPYSATLTTDSDAISLGGTDVKGDIVFGGFNANLFTEMTASEFKQNVTAPEGATISVTRAGSALDDAQRLQSGDIVSVTSANGKVTNEYLVSLTKFALSSKTYQISNNFVISDVYEYTPVSKFMSYLTVGDDWDVTLKNGEEEVTGGLISEEMIVEAVNTDGTTQVYTIDIPDRQSITTAASSTNVVFTNPINNHDDFRGNFVIELETTVASGYYTGPEGNNALYINATDSEVKLGLYKNSWSAGATQSTDLAVGEPLSVVFVVRPVTTDASPNNMLDYYINGDYTGTCSMDSVKSAIWTKWRVHANTSASFYMVEDVVSYLASKNANDIYKTEDGTVGVGFAAGDAQKLYMAVYDGNKMESVQIANIADYIFKNNTLSVPFDVAGKKVKAFLWGANNKPLDAKIIQE